MANTVEADLIPEYEARIAALERLVGRQALELEFLKGAQKRGRSLRKRVRIRNNRPSCISVRRGCELMGLPRSAFYADAGDKEKDPVIDEIKSITDTCRGYGYRRVTAELRHRGMIVNSKKVRVRREIDSLDRFLILLTMRENSLNPKRKRRYVATTDSDHDRPIYPNVAKGYCVHGPDQLWVADITYVAIATGFAYLAVVLYAWSPRSQLSLGPMARQGSRSATDWGAILTSA